MWRDCRVAAALLALALPARVFAGDETSVVLAAGDGAAETRAACAACHSLDYIVMNSPFLDAGAWEKTVGKIVRVMGAPIAPDQVAIIVRYLAEYYGEQASNE
jgi:mono/diheme cytochrome c family protein